MQRCSAITLTVGEDPQSERRFTVVLGRSLAIFNLMKQDLFEYEILNTQN